VKLPRLPSSVFSLLGPVPVLVMDLSTEEGGNETLLGIWNAARRDIRVRPLMAPVTALHTLYHEQTHCWLWDAGVRLTSEQEEAVCDAIATARVAELLERK
jgi:hypothetical protein